MFIRFKHQVLPQGARVDGQGALLPLYFFGVAGDKESQRSLLHFDVVPRVDEDAGYSETDTACKLTPAHQAAHANNSLIKRNGTHSWKVLHQGRFFCILNHHYYN